MRSRLNLSMSCIRILRDGILGLCCFLLWAWLSPEAWGQQLSIFLLSFIVFIGLDGRSNLPLSSPGDWLLALEMAYPKAKQSAFNLNKQAFLDPDWQHLLALELAKHRQESRQLLIVKASSLLLPGLLLLFLIQTAGYSWTGAMHSLQKVALSLSYGAKLRVIEGAVETNGGLLKLTSKTIELTVLEQNLIEVLVTAAPDAVPILQLQNQANKPLQTFRLTKTPGPEGMESIGNYSVTFALTEDAKLFLNTVSDHQAVALIHVKKLPIPQVELSSQAVPDAAWPDDKPLPLHIEVKAEHPLQSLQLLIKSGDRVHKELVTEVLAKDKQDLTIDYRLALETFLEQDLQELEIVAEATDRAFPVALVGRSKPLIIKVASAYGRYKQTLQTLREAKSELDRAIEGQDAFAPKNLAELGKKASQQAEDSPFFDGLDRHQIKQFDESFAKIAKSIDMELVAQASEDLNRFLFEHESLDDRERDRDFFVAARSLSRLLEQKTEDRPISIGKIADHLATFLAERQQRWQQRVQYLGANHRPEEWESVRKKPFEQALKSLVQDDRSQPPKSAEALQKLSQTVESYRQWIEALEAKEDSARAEQEKQRQQGLANAQNQLKELQRRQAQVSIKLDKAASRSAEDIEQSWASVRMDQNSNIKGTREMEGQLRSLSPSAGERIKAALGAMETTVESGNQQHYAEAESTSDLAGRLLQQAESAARQSQRDSGKRGRRRRVTSDQYYGNQVAGGDVDMRRDYKVNRRYREDVLEDVRQFKKRESTEDSGILLEDYLRKVIR